MGDRRTRRCRSSESTPIGSGGSQSRTTGRLTRSTKASEGRVGASLRTSTPTTSTCRGRSRKRWQPWTPTPRRRRSTERVTTSMKKARSSSAIRPSRSTPIRPGRPASSVNPPSFVGVKRLAVSTRDSIPPPGLRSVLIWFLRGWAEPSRSPTHRTCERPVPASSGRRRLAHMPAGAAAAAGRRGCQMRWGSNTLPSRSSA